MLENPFLLRGEIVVGIPGGFSLLTPAEGSTLPPGPLGSNVSGSALAALRRQYDLILIDTSATSQSDTACRIGKIADATVVVARCGLSTREDIKNTTRQLVLSGIHPIGLALDDA